MVYHVVGLVFFVNLGLQDVVFLCLPVFFISWGAPCGACLQNLAMAMIAQETIETRRHKGLKTIPLGLAIEEQFQYRYVVDKDINAYKHTRALTSYEVFQQQFVLQILPPPHLKLHHPHLNCVPN